VIFSSRNPYEILAAKNATLRLRAPTGHVFSFTDLTSAHGAVNFGHLNPAIDPFGSLTSDVAASFYPPSAASYRQWLRSKLELDAHAVLYKVGADAALGAAIGQARRARAGKVLMIEGSRHSGLIHAGESSRRAIRIAPGGEFNAWHDVSCLIYEPIQGASGYVPLPLPWLRALSQSAQDAGVTVIADETQCGFFRFGRLSLAASEYLRPDVYLFGNSMTNGIYPLFAIVCPESLQSEIPVEEEGWDHVFHTAAVGFEAATMVGSYIDSTDIEGLVAQIHAALGQAGEKLAANPQLSSFHLAGPTLSLEVRNEGAAKLVNACEERGVLVSMSGRRVRVAPPLTIALDQLTTALKALEKAARTL
jgi:acetylornithine/succinyldiaminopimelate/putrescine aminotransferase